MLASLTGAAASTEIKTFFLQQKANPIIFLSISPVKANKKYSLLFDKSIFGRPEEVAEVKPLGIILSMAATF